MTINIQKKSFCHFCGNRLERKSIEGMRRLYCELCQTPIYENPIPATCLVVANEKKQIVLVKRSVEPKKGMWCLPGGFIELFESPDRAALRELKEETNLVGEIDKLLGVRSNANPVYGTVFMVGYLVKKFSGNIFAGDDASDINFFSDDNLPEIAFDSHKHFIKLFFGFTD